MDTHQHLLYTDEFSYPWAAGLPPLQGNFTLDDYWKAASGTPIAGSLFVEVDVPQSEQGGEARFVCALAEDPANRILGVIASCRPENEGFGHYLDSIHHSKLKGLRRVLHTVDDGVSQGARFAENIALLGERDLTFDLCVRADQLPLALTPVRKCRGVQFVLDHCGIPDVKGQALDPWRDHIVALAGEPNIACKLSGIAADADPEKWTAHDLRPFVDHVLSCFGWERMIFGGDWPVCNLAGNLRRWADAAWELTAAGTDLQREALFSGNAVRIYKL